MSTAILNEIVEKVAVLTSAERGELIQLLQKQQIEKQLEESKNQPQSEYQKSPNINIEWLKQNSHKYRGLHVALKDGQLIATGRSTKEADLAAKAKGFDKTLWAYIPEENEELWGGW